MPTRSVFNSEESQGVKSPSWKMTITLANLVVLILLSFISFLLDETAYFQQKDKVSKIAFFLSSFLRVL